MTGQGGGLPLSSPSLRSRPTFPFSSCGQPSFPFSGCLEVHNKGPVCFASSPTWSSSQFRVSAAFDHQPGALPSAGGQQQERAPKGRDSSHVEKGSHRESVEQVLSGVLQPVVCNPQKERETSLGHRSAIFESPPKKGEVSHGNTRKSAPLHSKRGLGDLCRFDGRISACSNPPIVEEVSSFLLSGRSVPVSGSALRVVSEPESLHPRSGCDDGPCLVTGLSSSPLSGRLAPEEPTVGPPQDSDTRPPSLNNPPRLDSQPGEVGVNSNSRLCLYRHTLSNRSGADVPSSSSVPRSSQSCSPVPPGEVCDSSGLSFTSREVGVNVRSGTLRSSQISASSALPPSSLATQSGSAIRPDPVGSSLLGPISEMVDQAVQCSSRETHSGSSPSVGHIHRCLHQRLGGPLQQSVSSRSVVSNRNISTHKRVGDVSHSEGCPPLPPPDQGQGGDDPLRQQLSSCLPTESGGHSLSAHVSSHMANPSGVPAAGYHPVSEAHPRSSQCSSRQPVEMASNHRHRMVSTPQRSAPDVLHLVHSRVGPVRNSSQQQTGSICVSSSGPSGCSSGCSVNPLGQTLGICLSSDCANATSTSQVSALRSVSNATGGATSALSTLASNVTRVAGGLSPEGAPISTTPEATSVGGISQPSRTGSSVRLELIQRGLRERQFSEAVAHRLCQTVRASTAGIYDCKWRVYESWCRTEQISPLQASVQQLAEFFEFLFSTRKLASSTIKGYRSAISTVFRLQGGWNPGTDPILSSLLRAFDIERPKSPKIVPQWNLALVLQAFLEEPFEPMDCCAMKFLTWKTVFLVALASARRVSCLHALSLEPDPQQPDLPGSLRFGRHKTDVTIFTNPAFVAKNQRLEPNPPVVIKSLRSFIASQEEPDNKLCPVRALLYYLKRTQARRGNCFRLFLPYKLGLGDNKLQPDSISRWIKSAVRQAYTSAGNSEFVRGLVGISAHEVRAIATSWAAFNSAPVEDILKAAYWNSETTFTNFYLRDMSGFSEQIHRLGPLSVAQTTVAR